ncbi:MAG TPA: hypothetical protein VLX68_00135 [Chitinivibrionales bacterium]|nr:hypothetical protein [Chitinivibrionales bacterium]
MPSVRGDRRPRWGAVLPGAPRSGLAPWQPEAKADDPWKHPKGWTGGRTDPSRRRG